MKTQLRPALTLFVGFSLLTGLIYPLAVTAIAQIVFPHQANGSLITRAGKIVGSELIGQNFEAPRYFWGRLSATGPFPFNAGASSGSNYGPLNPALHDAVKARVGALKKVDPNNTAPIPVDLVTSSASGLDPHVSPAAAAFQIARVAKARNWSEEKVRELVAQNTQNRAFGVLSEAGVNVLQLNLALDASKP